MNEKTKTIGIDGREYDSSTARVLGDRHALMERQMAEDIQNQNKLIKENMQLQQDIANQNYRLEMQKEENRKSEAEKQREHDKEMRLLNLFDEIGISKKTYDDYIIYSYSTINNKIVPEINQHNSLKWQYEDILNDIEDSFDYDEELFKINKEIESKCRDKDKNKNVLTIENKKDLYKNLLSISIVVAFFSFVLLCFIASEFDSNLYIFPLVIMFISIPASIVLFKLYSTYDDKSKYVSDVDYVKKRNLLKNLIVQENEKVTDLKNKLSKSIKPVVEEFYQFRVNHYNSKIEKILNDIGYIELVEDYGCEFKKVNNSNKKKDGTIEDYIEYFETHS